MRRLFGVALLGLVSGVSAFGWADDDLAGTWALTSLAPKGATAADRIAVQARTKTARLPRLLLRAVRKSQRRKSPVSPRRRTSFA